RRAVIRSSATESMPAKGRAAARARATPARARTPARDRATPRRRPPTARQRAARSSKRRRRRESSGPGHRCSGPIRLPMSLQRHLGPGIGLRPPHYPRILDGTAQADWFEVISENFMIGGGRPLHVLEQARALAPIVLHGVSMNLGGTDPLNERHLDAL